MNNIITSQLYSMGIFLITGILIGILFDIFRILRKSFNTANIFTYIEDILFWILAGTMFMFVLFKFNNGELRGYVFFSLGFGVIIYLLTISKYFVNINVKIVGFIKKILSYPVLFVKKCIKSTKNILIKKDFKD